ncbi:MAG TPA: hypothetical protein VEB60_01985 [Candidatus Paceibacterota bacterium]|nr:hypothetical protein [Candidatus Paceibacterota bacterium]
MEIKEPHVAKAKLRTADNPPSFQLAPEGILVLNLRSIQQPDIGSIPKRITLKIVDVLLPKTGDKDWHIVGKVAHPPQAEGYKVAIPDYGKDQADVYFYDF